MMELPIPPRVARETNPEIVEILKAAKVYLWDGTGDDVDDKPNIVYRYICAAIDFCEVGDQDLQLALMREITVSLLPHVTYCTWVVDQLRDSERRNQGLTPGDQEGMIPSSEDDIQAGRLRWINQLIEEYGGVP